MIGSQPDWAEYRNEAAEWTCSASDLETLPVSVTESDWTYPPDSGTRSLYSVRDVSRPVRVED